MRLLSCAFVVAATAWSASAWAQSHAGHHHGGNTPLQGAPIVVTINPEARVSATWMGPAPPAPVCGSAVEIPVAVVNQAFVTSALQAEIVGLAPAGATLRAQQLPLSGHASDTRAIELTLSERGPSDITIEFSIPNERPDLGGRARVHFLVACRS